MAILNSQEYLYLSVSKGILRNKKKNIETRGYEGILIGIEEVEDSYEGVPRMRVNLKMKDPKSKEVAIIQFNEETWFSIGFFSRIQKIDITKPFTLGVSPSEKNEKISFCWLKQEGVFNEKKEPKVEADKDFPKPVTTKIGRNEVQDWGKPIERILTIIDELKAKLGDSGNLGTGGKPDALDQSLKSKPLNPFALVANAGPDDDLPF